MWTISTKYIYIIILVVILVVLAYINKDIFYTLYEGNEDSDLSNQAITNASKLTSSKTYLSIGDGQLNAIDSEIESCMNLINDINQRIPYKIQDIIIGEVSQSENEAEVGINIESSITDKNINPITNESMETAVWTLSVVLPKGRKGIIGDKGPKGDQGESGEQGPIGEQGQQGPWGDSNECSTCK